MSSDRPSDHGSAPHTKRGNMLGVPWSLLVRRKTDGKLVRPLRRGDPVWYPSRSGKGAGNLSGTGVVTSVSGDGVNPCPCCGYGVGVQPNNDPNVGMGFAAGDLVPLDRAPALWSKLVSMTAKESP